MGPFGKPRPTGFFGCLGSDADSKSSTSGRGSASGTRIAGPAARVAPGLLSAEWMQSPHSPDRDTSGPVGEATSPGAVQNPGAVEYQMLAQELRKHVASVRMD